MKTDALPSPRSLLVRWRAHCIFDRLLYERDYHDWHLEAEADHGVLSGTFDNGSGDQLYAHWFADGSCVLWGFAHEAPMTPYRVDPPEPWPGLLATLPERFKPLQPMEGPEPAPLTFAVWMSAGEWTRDPLEFPLDEADPDGSKDLLEPLLSDEAACDYTCDMYEVEPSRREAILAVLAKGDADAELLRGLCPDATDDLEKRLADIADLPH
ncbi:MAG: hypothetical protein KDC95_03950 [Planctomycetes bacterium]|nr:hypothetical protein [Planctomycetota bacterium]